MRLRSGVTKPGSENQEKVGLSGQRIILRLGGLEGRTEERHLRASECGRLCGCGVSVRDFKKSPVRLAKRCVEP